MRLGERHGLLWCPGLFCLIPPICIARIILPLVMFSASVHLTTLSSLLKLQVVSDGYEGCLDRVVVNNARLSLSLPDERNETLTFCRPR